MNLTNFKWDQDADGIVTLTWDVPGRTMNVLTGSAIAEIAAVADKVASDAAIKGLVITSGKANGFCAGAALDEMEGSASRQPRPQSPEEAVKARFDGVMAFHHAARKLETCGKPVAAAINGLALGGGLEVALACHYRVAADNPKIQLGLPEAKVGLLPGGGGTQRLPRLIGAMQALPLLLQGTSVDPQKALGLKLVHKVAPADQLVAEAKAWIKANPDAAQPWDKKDFACRAAGPIRRAARRCSPWAPRCSRKQSYGNYPAQRYIMSCVYEGLIVPIDAALRIEARYFTKLLMQPESRNMIRSLFLSMQELGKGARRPAGEPKTEVKTVGVIGAGVMGYGIAYVSALAGIEVVLIDATAERAQAGKANCAKILDKAISRGKSSPEKKAEVLGRINATADYDALKHADLVIEAVFEDRGVKAEVTKKAEAVMPASAIYGSNTSTLPITGLAEASERPEQFIGIHFFSPVDRMGLVEIIMGKKTGSKALAIAVDYVQKIRKTPIVVNDARGFYTSRCFGTYPGEGMAMVAEGIHPAMVENVGRMRHADGRAGSAGQRRPRHPAQDRAPDPQGSGHQRARPDGNLPRGCRREKRPPGPQERQGLLRLRRQGQARAALAGADRQPQLEHRCRCGGDEAALPHHPGAGSRALFRGRRAHRSARCRCRRHSRLGLRALHRRADFLHRHDRRQGLRRALRGFREEVRRALQAQQAAARHGREGRNLLQPLRPGQGGGGLNFPPPFTGEGDREAVEGADAALRLTPSVASLGLRHLPRMRGR